MFPIDSPSMCHTPALNTDDGVHLEHQHHHQGKILDLLEWAVVVAQW